MAFPPAFLDDLRARVALSEVVGRRVKLSRRGREFVGLCPFHNEKSPSFTVSDDKGFYHCFGCQAHGSIFDFVMNSEGVDFPEAVERVAGIAGVPVPKATPAAAEQARRQATLYEVIEKAATWFGEYLRTQAGREARDYLKKRGLAEATIQRFRLGYAPDLRTALKDALIARGASEEQLLAAGLLIQPEDGAATFDRFRHRVMFPIADVRGRVIAFGGRALSDAAKAKYLNSPETPLFHKGHVLYALNLARDAIRDSGTALIAEGYMDVIALHQADFGNAVAPLGTALTTEQMTLLWKLAPEPLVCLDGDAAGQRAALAAAERALPLLKPGQSLRFSTLPAGEDPDSLIKAQGPEAMRSILERATPLAELLWEREIGAQPVDSPEREAGLRARLGGLSRQIQDATVREAYERLFRVRFEETFQQPIRSHGNEWSGRQAGKRPFGHRWQGKAPEFVPRHPTAALKNTTLVRGHQAAARERLIVALVLHWPAILHDQAGEDTLAHLHLEDRNLDRLRAAILNVAASGHDLDSTALRNHLAGQGLGEVAERVAVSANQAHPILQRSDVAIEDVARLWREAMEFHRQPEHDADILEAFQQYVEEPSDGRRARLRALQEDKAHARGLRTRGNLLH
ncbi:MAG: DNA primase [Alphaproteobacteria bacterium]|nr:DNA primase [Alphaproteobacteria bacterium]